MTNRDLEYLADKDALTIPDIDFRDELLRTYVNIVHPFMPALDLDSFLDPIIRGHGHTPVSLLVFQAVMFASVTFVDKEFLQARGYSSRRAARKIFFNRVRLLYGLDCEPDRLALMQALLLMTYWYNHPDDEKDTWYWMGITLSLAQVLGLHRDPEQLPVTPQEKRLRRRLWWSCVMRDRLLALGIRRPARIRDSEFDVPPLTLDDFSCDTSSDAMMSLLGKAMLTRTQAQTMAVMCVELSQLCVCLGHVLHSQYTVLGNGPAGHDNFPKPIVQPRRSGPQAQELTHCDVELTEWLRSQDSRSRYTSGQTNDDEASRIIRLHQALLHMIYLTVQGALHRPQVFYSESDPSVRKVSREKVTEAAIAMTKLAFDLQASNQLRYLSTSSIPTFLSATLIHVLEIRSPDEEVRNISIGRFYQCVQALHQLQDMYASADYAVRYLERVLKSTDVHIPMLKLGTTESNKNQSSQWNQFGQSTTSQMDRTATAYPSPSSARQFPTGAPDLINDSMHVDRVQSLSPLFDGLDAWPSLTSQIDITQQPTELPLPSPYAGMWSDVDSLIPALINFTDGPQRLMSDGSTRQPGWS